MVKKGVLVVLAVAVVAVLVVGAVMNGNISVTPSNASDNSSGPVSFSISEDDATANNTTNINNSSTEPSDKTVNNTACVDIVSKKGLKMEWMVVNL